MITFIVYLNKHIFSYGVCSKSYFIAVCIFNFVKIRVEYGIIICGSNRKFIFVTKVFIDFSEFRVIAIARESDFYT